jgi:predicted small secreted protein
MFGIYSEEVPVKQTTLLAIVCAMLLSSACNTMHGLGKDIEKGGQAIEKAASK